MRTVEEHLATILDAVDALPVTEVAPLEALDLVLAADVVSPLDLPRFDNSAMDGYAVRRDEVLGASADQPVALPVAGEIGAGQRDAAADGGSATVVELPVGQVAKIMTGAPLPTGADAVVPYEWTDRGADVVHIDQVPEPAHHVRVVGEDVTVGEVLAEAGTVVGPRHVGLLAAVGLTAVPVRRRPRIAIISTGEELREPGEPLAPDAIYDGNSRLLAAAALRCGAEPVRVGIVPDDPDAFLAVLQARLADVDAVVTSGGISMGDYDVVKAALRAHDGVWFGGVALQPGKPQGFGLLPGADPDDAPTPFFALPGNPVSSYLSFELFVRPALRRMAGHARLSRGTVEARLTHAVTSPAGRRQLLRAVLTGGPRGYEAEPIGGPASHLLGDLANADAVIVVPEDVTEVAAGETVYVMRLDGDE